MAAGRREEYAELTRRDVIDSARTLFAESGYHATTVADIADAARVSQRTVYHQCGGKRGLLHALVGDLTPQRSSFEIVSTTRDLMAVGVALTECYLRCWRDAGDLVQLAVQTAAHDVVAANAIAAAATRHRVELRSVAGRLRERGVLTEACSDDDFADVVLYHYGPQSGFHVTVTVLGWSVDRAAAFLTARITRGLSAAAPAPARDTCGTGRGSRSSGSARSPSSR